MRFDDENVREVSERRFIGDHPRERDELLAMLHAEA